jgi:hypothetical protein
VLKIHLIMLMILFLVHICIVILWKLIREMATKNDVAFDKRLS